MRGRRISTEKRKSHKKVPPKLSRTAMSWGSTKRGCSGHGYSSFGGYTPYPSGVLVVDNIGSMACGGSVTAFLKLDGTLYTVGDNEDVGAVGNGTSTANVLIPEQITGGVPLYPYKEGYTSKVRAKWTQPQGPTGPLLSSLEPVAICGANGDYMFALTRDGRVVGWGSGQEGVLGNGNNNMQAGAPIIYEPTGVWPQWAPWFVQTEGPALVPVISPTLAAENEVAPISEAEANTIKAEAETKALTNIVAIAATDSRTAAFLDTSGELRRTGQPVGDPTRHLYAELDPTWTPGKPTGAGKKAVGMALSKNGCLLLLEDHTVSYVGANEFGQWGDGRTIEGVAPIKQVSDPKLTKVIAVAKGEYTCFALKDDFSVWAWGGNQRGQLASGLPAGEIWHTPKEIVSLRPSELGGAKVIAIAASGVRTGSGANNGDVIIVLLSDSTIRTWGSNWALGDTASEAYIGWGTLGINTTETVGRDDTTYQIPQQVKLPDGSPLKDIVGIFASPTHMAVIKEPGTLIESEAKATVEGEKAKITWAVPGDPGVVGKLGMLPRWRDPEGWNLAIKSELKAGAVATSPTLVASAREWATPALPPGEYYANINEKYKVEEPVVKGGEIQKAVGGKLTIEWGDPVNPVPGWIITVQRTASFIRPGTGKRDYESGTRITPERTPGTRTATITLPPPGPHDFEGQDLEQVKVKVSGVDKGATQTRKVYFTIT